MAVKRITAEALSMLVSPRDRAEVITARYDDERRVLEIELADVPVRPLFVLETDAALTEEQVKTLKARAEEMMGDAYKVVLLAHGIKGKVIPASMSKAD